MAKRPSWTTDPFAYAGANPPLNVDPLGLFWGGGSVKGAIGAIKKGAQAGGDAVASGAGAVAAGIGSVATSAKDAAIAARDCLADVKCSSRVALALDSLAAAIDTAAAFIVDAVTIAACATTGPVGCLIGYGLSTLAVQVLLLPGNVIGVIATVVGCTGTLAGSEKDGGGWNRTNALSCGESILITSAGVMASDANINAILADYSVCRDLGKCKP
jgi:hypothetical protein